MSFLLIISSVLLNCLAQIFMKKLMINLGTMNLSNSISMIPLMLVNYWMWLAMISYGISIFLWMAVLSRCEVSFAYPFLSIGYIVAAVIGYYFFNEQLSSIRIFGILVICFGVYLISRS